MRACAESMQSLGALALEHPGAESVQLNSFCRARVRRWAPRVAQPPALAMARERVLVLASVRVRTPLQARARVERGVPPQF